VGLTSKRSLQRYLRVLQSPLAPFLASGWLAAWRADRMLADPEHVRRFLELVADFEGE
jgi:hypothetical protein